MQPLPLADPGAPDLRSPLRYLLRITWLQRWTVLGGMALGIVWMGAQALVPYVLGRVVDEGIAGRDEDALRRWVLVLLALAVAQGAAGVLRHRFAVANWILATFRTVQWVSAQTIRLGASLNARTSTGEVVSVSATELLALGGSYAGLWASWQAETVSR